jgi:hypothetical protein
LPACALLMLNACGTPPRVVDRVVKVPVPVRAPLDPRLTADCPPDVEVPLTGPLPVAAALRREDAVEAALTRCRAQLEQLRSLDTPTGG